MPLAKRKSKSKVEKESARKSTRAAYFKCKQCLGYIQLKLRKSHVCAVPTEHDLIQILDEEGLEAWSALREYASGLGPNRIYASAKAIMFARRICYLFVRPKAKGLELCFFLDRSLKHPMIKRVQDSTRTKFAHTLVLKHRDEVEEPLTSWLREAWALAE